MPSSTEIQSFEPDNLPVLYADDDLLVIEKPAGLRVIQDGYHPELPSVKSLLDARFGRVFIVHRLDKETSGILIVARNAFSHRALNDQFENRRVSKEYHALVITPTPFPRQLIIDQPLFVDADRRHRTRVDPHRGKPAQTEFVLLTQFSTVALVRAFPKTGYTHQIRAHALYAGFPLLGDTLYSLPAKSTHGLSALPEFSRVALHAHRIEFSHPRTRKPLSFTSQYPADFALLLAELNK